MEQGTFLTQELEQSRQPVRPGEPGVRPFWNKYAKRFVFAPAFDLPQVAGAVRYQFTVESAEGTTQTFHADQPWAPLTPVWDKLTQGLTHLKVEGLNASYEAIGIAGEFAFYRAPVFNGPYHEPLPITYTEAGRNGLRALFSHSKFQHWLKEGKPDPAAFLNCFAAKEMGASIRGMVAYAGIAESRQEAVDALKIARIIADFLIDNSEPEGSRFEYFPPVYWANPDDDIEKWPTFFRNVIKENRHTIMLSEPTRAAFGYLDLFDATREERYFEAALRVGRTFVNIRRNDGTWPLKVHRETGEELVSKPVIPTWILFFFERLKKQYQITEFDAVSDDILQWLLDHPVKGFHWDAQFEDVKLKEPYRKMANEQAADTAYYLFSNHENKAERIRLAEELLRFVEDQFVVWEKPTDGWVKLGLPGGPTKYGIYPVEGWITPAVIEQYGYVLVARATSVIMRLFAKAHEATGKAVYLAKARSLANTLVVAQQYHGGGEIPSYPMTSKQKYWTNNSIYTALFLLELGSKIACV